MWKNIDKTTIFLRIVIVLTGLYILYSTAASGDPALIIMLVVCGTAILIDNLQSRKK